LDVRELRLLVVGAESRVGGFCEAAAAATTTAAAGVVVEPAAIDATRACDPSI